MNTQPHPASTPRDRAMQVAIFVLLLITYAYVLPRWADWNANSRINMVFAVVDDGTLQIDKYVPNTGDYAKFEGHYYMDKAPGLAMLGVPVYAIAKPVLNSGPVRSLMERVAASPSFAGTLKTDGTGLLTEKIYFLVVLYLCSFVLVTIPAALLGVLLYRLLRDMGLGLGWSAAITAIYGLATPAYPYSGLFIGHQFVAVLLFAAFYIAWEIRRGRARPVWSLVAGFALGYTLISEYPTALIIAGVGLYMLYALPQKRWAVPFILMGVPPLLLAGLHNYAIFHTPLPVGYNYSELYTQEHSQGLISLTLPHWDAFWGVTFGSFRGLFYVSPVLLLGLVGFVAWWRSGKLRAELVVCAWATASFFLFNSSSVMWSGGFGIGPRYLVPMLPFFALGVGAFAVRWGRAAWARALVMTLAAYSFAVVWAQSLGGQSFPDWTPDPLFNYTLPRLAQGDIARNLGMAVGLRNWMSLLPLAVFMLVLAVYQWRLASGQKPVVGDPWANVADKQAVMSR